MGQRAPDGAQNRTLAPLARCQGGEGRDGKKRRKRQCRRLAAVSPFTHLTDAALSSSVRAAHSRHPSKKTSRGWRSPAVQPPARRQRRGQVAAALARRLAYLSFYLGQRRKAESARADFPPEMVAPTLHPVAGQPGLGGVARGRCSQAGTDEISRAVSRRQPGPGVVH